MVLMRTSTAVSLLAALLLAGCGGSEKETGPDVSAEASAPAVASSEPPAAIVSPADNPLAILGEDARRWGGTGKRRSRPLQPPEYE